MRTYYVEPKLKLALKLRGKCTEIKYIDIFVFYPIFECTSFIIAYFTSCTSSHRIEDCLGKT